MPKTLLQKFRTARKNLHLTQEEVAKKLNLSAKGYSKIESGRNELRFEHIKPLCNILNLSYLDALQTINPICDDPGQAFLDHNLMMLYGQMKTVNYAGMKLQFTPEEDAMYRLMAEYFCMDVNDKELLTTFLRLTYNRVNAGGKTWYQFTGKPAFQRPAKKPQKIA